jgi:hypothetical protein
MMSVNSKSLLGVFITKYTKACCSKQSIKYVTEQFGHQYQTTITLVSLGKHQGKPPPLFASELCSNKQEAEFSAAQKALGAHADDLSPSLFLSFYLSPSLSISLSLSLPLSLSLCLSLSLFLSLSLSLFFSLSLSFSLPLSLYISLSLSLYISLPLSANVVGKSRQV